MSIIKAINNSFDIMKKRGWNRIYYYFDLHQTIIYPDYNNKTKIKLYPYAKDVLKHLSKRKDISINMYTCSYPQEIQKYLKFFQEIEINFEYVNKNPEVENSTYGYYEDKPYFNVLFDDKCGFDAEEDWFKIAKYFNLINDNDEYFDMYYFDDVVKEL